jgi:hypothetical protein
MHAAQRARERDPDAQNFSECQGSTDQSIERFATGILEHQRHAVLVAGEFDRPRRPRTVEVGFECILMFEPLEGRGQAVARGHQEYRHQAASEAPAKREVTLPQG